MRRLKTDKRIELTQRDIQLFTLLERYRYLRSTYLHAFVGGASEKRFKERLGHLFHEGGYLNRPSQQWEFAGSRYAPTIYENSNLAHNVLKAQGCAEGARRTGSSMARHGQFAHTLMVCEILASFELAARSRNDLRLIMPAEILLKAPPASQRDKFSFRIRLPRRDAKPEGPLVSNDEFCLVPDALFGLEYLNGGKASYRFFAVEADRATMPVCRADWRQSSYFRKMLAYRDIVAQQVHKTQLGIPNLLVLNVTTNTPHQETMMRALHGATGGSTMFLFKTMNPRCASGNGATPQLHLLTAPWDRAGNAPIAIDRP